MKPMTMLLINGISDKLINMDKEELDYLASVLVSLSECQSERIKNSIGWAQQEYYNEVSRYEHSRDLENFDRFTTI